MATSAFKSTTKRSSVGGADDRAAAGSANRRSRSLSRPPSPGPRRESRLVNTVRGSVTLDDDNDNDDDFFTKLKQERSRSAARRRTGDAGGAAQRRGRSVSRPHGRVVDESDGSSKKTSSSSSSWTTTTGSGPRRRSASVARYQFSDSESEEPFHKSNHLANAKSFGGLSYRNPSSHKLSTPNHQRVLKKSLSQKELSRSCDGYSSHSSALTDEEARDTRSNKNGAERTIRTVYSQQKREHPAGDAFETGMFEVMRQEIRHAVEDIRTELEQGAMNINHSIGNIDSLQSDNADVLQAVSVIRKNYTAKLEQSEKRKQDLLAEIVAEEHRGQELSKIVKELLPEPKNTPVQENLSLGRKTNDRSWMSKCLTEDAEKYFDDFLSNVEDTDISSFDGERSDASSTVGAKKSKDPGLQYRERETAGLSTRTTSFPVEMDGIVLPWLQWETGNDGTPTLSKNKVEDTLIPDDNSCGSSQGESSTYKQSNIFSTASCSPCRSVFSLDDIDNRFEDHGMNLSQSLARRTRKSYLDMDEYLHDGRIEEAIFETWRQREGISSGSLILCTRSCFEL